MFKAKSFRPRLKSTKRSRCIAPPSRCRVQILPRSFRPECRILLVESCLMTFASVCFGMLKGLYLYNSVYTLFPAPCCSLLPASSYLRIFSTAGKLWNLEALNVGISEGLARPRKVFWGVASQVTHKVICCIGYFGNCGKCRSSKSTETLDTTKKLYKKKNYTFPSEMCRASRVRRVCPPPTSKSFSSFCCLA